MADLCTADYKSSCRLCLSHRGNLSIFDPNNDELGPLSSRIFACLSVEVCQTDSLPKQICQRCLSLMNVWHYFKLECDSAQRKLKKWLSVTATVPNQEEVHLDGNFILREVLNIKLEPEDDLTTDTSMVVDVELEEIPPTSEGGRPGLYSGSDVACRDFHQEQISEVSIDREEQQINHDSMNLVISETSSVAVDCRSGSTGLVQSSQIDEFDESHIRLVLENDDLDCDAHSVNNNTDEISITYDSSSSANRTVLEITLEDSADKVDSQVPLSEVNSDIAVSLETNGKDLSNNSLQAGLIDVKAILMNLKKEPSDTFEQYGIQIKKEIEDIQPASDDDNMVMTRQSSLTSAQRPSPNVFNAHVSAPAPRKFSCSFCKLRFKTQEQKDTHEKRRHQKKTSNLSLTDQVYNYQSITLSKISNELFDEAATYCKICKRRYGKNQFWRHIKNVHIKEDPFKCAVCKKVFPGRRELVTHRVRTVSKYCREGRVPEIDMSLIATDQGALADVGGQFKCKVCFQSFVRLGEAQRHTRVHSGEKPFFCFKCNREFLVRKSAHNHVTSCKGNVSPDSSYASKSKKSKTFSAKVTHTPVVAVNDSKHVPSNDKIKRCSKCSRIFNSGVGLNNHSRFCKGLRKCFTCYKSVSRVNFKRHSQYCARKHAHSLSTEDQMSNSLPTISTEKVCEAPGTTQRRNAPITNIVDMSVGELEALHFDKDGKLSEMVCKLCNKKMGSRKSLSAHLLKHSAKAFKCNVCNLIMRRYSTYEAHMKNCHGEHDSKMGENPPKSTSVDLVKSKASLKFVGFRASKLKCEICQKHFGSLASLNYHKQSHTKIKCKLCGIICPASMEKLHVCIPKPKSEQVDTFQNPVNFGHFEEKTVTKRMFTCQLCQKRFHTKKMLSQHAKMHIKMKIYKCKSCSNSYSNAGALQLHKQTEHAEEMKPAAYSAQDDVAGQSMTSTVSEEAKKKPWQCITCNKQYSCKDSLSRHMKLHKGSVSPMFIGGAAFAVEKPDAPGILFCSLCNRAFDSKVSFLGHKGWHSRQQAGKTKPSSVVKPPVKNLKKISNNVDSSSASSIQVSGDKSSASQNVCFKCNLCYKRFSSPKNLKCHLAYHRKGLIRSSKCNTPKEKTTPVITLQSILPLPKDAYKCKICPDTFLEESLLLVHMKSHIQNSGNTETEDRVVEPKQELMTCKLCNKEYRSQKSLKIHMMGHSGEKPFKCRSCSNRYNNSKALARHEKERHSSILRPFSCNRCTTSFMVKEDLLAHYEKCTH